MAALARSRTLRLSHKNQAPQASSRNPRISGIGIVAPHDDCAARPNGRFVEDATKCTGAPAAGEALRPTAVTDMPASASHRCARTLDYPLFARAPWARANRRDDNSWRVPARNRLLVTSGRPAAASSIAA